MPTPDPQRTLRTLAIALLLIANAIVLFIAIQQPPSTHVVPASADPGYRVRINHADADHLQLLHGVGPSLANNIITHRETHGPFQTTQQLVAVSRIGPKTLHRIEPWVSLD